MSENPITTPNSTPSAFPVGIEGDDVRAVRMQYLRHEASVKSVAWVYYFAIIPLAFGMALINFEPGIAGQPDEQISTMLVTVLLSGLAVLTIAIAWGFRRLKPWARWPAVLFSVLGVAAMLYSPIVGLINVYLLCYIIHLFLSPEARVVFSPEYAKVIEATPDIREKTSGRVLVLLILVGVVLMVAAIGTVETR